MRDREMRSRRNWSWASLLLLLLALGLFAQAPDIAKAGAPVFDRVQLAPSGATGAAQSLDLLRIESLRDMRSTVAPLFGAAMTVSAGGVPVTLVDRRGYGDAKWSYVTGTIRNDYTYPLRFVQIAVTTFDASGNIVESKVGYASSDYVRPGEVVAFTVIPSSPDWFTYSVSAAGQRATQPEPIHLTHISSTVTWMPAPSAWRKWNVVFRNDSAATITGLCITGIESGPSGFTGEAFGFPWDIVVGPGATVSQEMGVFLSAAAPVSLSGVQAEALSAVFPQLPKPIVSTPHGPSHAHHGRSFTVYGYLKPRHAYHSHPVSLRFYRYKSGHYVYYKTLKPSVYSVTYQSGAASKYRFTTSLPYAGKWRVRAYHSDSGHRATYGGYDYFRVY